MQRFHLCSLLVAVVMLTAAATPAFPAPPKSRSEALAGLRSPSEATRAEAVNWIASRGAMADAPLLHERLRDDSETVREFAEQGLWLLWGRSGDDEIDRRMARGTGEMQAGRLADSVATFSEIIRRKPDFAEGWNRRATAYYLAGEYEKSIADCAEVLKRNPQHFGALSGLGQIYFKLEDYERSLAWFRRALEVNPNMLGVEINIEGIEELLEEKRRRSI
ncbi:MAG: tetratricopeptide repeat protein [Betaproteobacteria bacterium]|nr:MAG: tetratricopeptide repeat protein [Betaproteobacteria bacterium]